MTPRGGRRSGDAGGRPLGIAATRRSRHGGPQSFARRQGRSVGRYSADSLTGARCSSARRSSARAPPSLPRRHGKCGVRLATIRQAPAFTRSGNHSSRCSRSFCPMLCSKSARAAGSVSNVQGIRQGVADLTFAHRTLPTWHRAGRLSDDEARWRCSAIAVLRPTPCTWSSAPTARSAA